MTISHSSSPRRPLVCLVGEHLHPEFTAAVELIRAEADVVFTLDGRACPDLVVVAQSRPGILSAQRIEPLRQAAPLAGVVILLGSWCEGQSRASRPLQNAVRLYWYQFPPWWRRQIELLAERQCPDWARPDRAGSLAPYSALTTQYTVSDIKHAARVTQGSNHRGLILLSTPHWETADILAIVLHRAGYATAWQPPHRPASVVRGVAAGIWDGGQLEDCEAESLSNFCRRLAADSAPVIVLLDFPRRDRCELAHRLGAAFVMSKPWENEALLTALRSIHPARHSSPAIAPSFNPSQ
jgi:hypothetical protein